MDTQGKTPLDVKFSVKNIFLLFTVIKGTQLFGTQGCRVIQYLEEFQV